MQVKLYLIYNVIKRTYGSNCSLLFTDTDSLCYEFRGHLDMYAELYKQRKYFDFSNYSKTHENYSSENRRKTGLFKDETAGIPIKSFIGLKSKMYSFTVGDKEKRTAKGIVKSTIINDLRHNMYEECLAQCTSMKHSMTMIKQIDYKLHIVTVTKKTLSGYDDKRYITSDGVTTLPYFHHRIHESRD